jgi:hypothetical protein
MFTHYGRHRSFKDVGIPESVGREADGATQKRGVARLQNATEENVVYVVASTRLQRERGKTHFLGMIDRDYAATKRTVPHSRSAHVVTSSCSEDSSLHNTGASSRQGKEPERVKRSQRS